MVIRQENVQDYDEVYTMVKSAFATAEHADGTEHDLVAALRGSEAFLPELSLVAEDNGSIVGHIMFTKAQIGERTELALAPLAILPGRQGQGIGTKLIREGHRIAGELGYGYSVVMGSETYYPRAGYEPAEQFGIKVPEGVPSANYMAIRLREDAEPVSGAVRYAKEFGM